MYVFRQKHTPVVFQLSLHTLIFNAYTKVIFVSFDKHCESQIFVLYNLHCTLCVKFEKKIIVLTILFSRILAETHVFFSLALKHCKIKMVLHWQLRLNLNNDLVCFLKLSV